MKNYAINVNSHKDISGKILSIIKEFIYTNVMDSNVVIFYDSIDLDKKENSYFDFIIVLGGDGTILSTARAVAQFGIPIMGINIGNLGFLADIESGEINNALKNLMENKFYVEERTMLHCDVLSGENSIFSYNCLNDIVLSKGTLSRIVKYEIHIDNSFYTSFSADGVILSTPTGSTAYSLSAGGPIMYPTLDLISITPICPHSLGIRTLVIDNHSIVTILFNENFEKNYLTVDGQESLLLSKENKVIIKTAPWKCKLIKFDNYNYFNVLRKKITTKTKECEVEINEI